MHKNPQLFPHFISITKKQRNSHCTRKLYWIMEKMFESKKKFAMTSWKHDPRYEGCLWNFFCFTRIKVKDLSATMKKECLYSAWNIKIFVNPKRKENYEKRVNETWSSTQSCAFMWSGHWFCIIWMTFCRIFKVTTSLQRISKFPNAFRILLNIFFNVGDKIEEFFSCVFFKKRICTASWEIKKGCDIYFLVKIEDDK